jgi:hypothetical protein
MGTARAPAALPRQLHICTCYGVGTLWANAHSFISDLCGCHAKQKRVTRWLVRMCSRNERSNLLQDGVRALSLDQTKPPFRSVQQELTFLDAENIMAR